MRRRRRGEALWRRVGRCWKNPTWSCELEVCRAALCASSHARDAPSVELRRRKTLRCSHENALKPCEACALDI